MKVICLESIFGEPPYFDTKEVHAIYNKVLCAISNFNKTFDRQSCCHKYSNKKVERRPTVLGIGLYII